MGEFDELVSHVENPSRYKPENIPGVVSMLLDFVYAIALGIAAERVISNVRKSDSSPV